MTFDFKINFGHSDLYSWSRDFSSFSICSEKHFSFIGKAQFMRAILSCDSSYCFSVRMFISSYFSHVSATLHQRFVLKFLKLVYLSNHSSESIHTYTWVMGILEGLLTFHKFWPQGPCPGMWLELKT